MRCWKSPVIIQCKIVLLDQQEFVWEASDKTIGRDVLHEVLRKVGVHESTYFGLRYIDSTNQTQWLDLTKTVYKQLKGNENCTFYFGVKYYLVDPCKLIHESTRYQFFLQLKLDVLQGRVPVNFDLVSELGAYVLQSELGDFDSRKHTPGYVSEFRFIANQTVELENRIALLHTELAGQQPALAELNFLEKVKWLEMYGVDLHPVLGEDNNEYFLGLSPTSVIVLRNKNKVATYAWPRITKIYHKGKYFMIRVAENKNGEDNTYGFETPSKSACKHLFKCSLDLRDFFKDNQSTDHILTRGKNEDFDVRGNQQFVRVPSKRYQRRPFDNQPSTVDKSDTIVERINHTSNEPASLPPEDWGRSESPKSTQSLPHPPMRGLYSSNSRISSSRRSISMESRSSADTKSFVSSVSAGSRKRCSDSESEASKGSSKSRRRRTRSKRGSGTRERKIKQNYVLVDSKEQWKEVQKKQAGNPLVQEARVISPNRPKSEGSDTLGTGRRRHRKGHRSRSRSPGESKKRLPDELKRHLQFNLIDTHGMSENQLREIPYTVVETSAAKAVKVKLSPMNKKAHTVRIASRRSNV